jgi:hypothetical protein
VKTIIFLVLLHATCFVCLVPRGYDEVSVIISDGKDTTSVSLKRPISLLNVYYGPFVVKKMDRDGRAAFYVGYDFQDVESCHRLSTKLSTINNANNIYSFTDRPYIWAKID